jgi:DNA-binding NarL/FixJ family response regulator
MDLSMPDLDGTGATKEIVKLGLPARVLILTMHAEEDYLVPLMEAGAAGYLVKSAADRELVDAVRAVAHGDVYVRAAAARVLAKNLTRKDPAQSERERFEKLTQRERDVLRLVAQGYSAPEIGERLFISPKTVDTYKQRIQEKLGLAHRSDYVQFALKLGLLAEA